MLTWPPVAKLANWSVVDAVCHLCQMPDRWLGEIVGQSMVGVGPSNVDVPAPLTRQHADNEGDSGKPASKHVEAGPRGHANVAHFAAHPA